MDLDDAVVIVGHDAGVLPAVLDVDAVVRVAQLRVSFLERDLSLLGVLKIRDLRIHALILHRALLPGQILLHAASAHGVEHLAVAEVNLDGIHDDQVQCLGRVIHEGEAGPETVEFLVGADRVAQAAGRVNDRHRAVAHGHHLGQAAGLKAGRHQIHIRACENRAGCLFVIVAGEADHSRPFCLRPVEIVHILLIALTEHDELDAQVHEAGQNLLHQLDALLLVQSRDEAEQRPLRGLDQIELLLDFPFAFRLAGHVVRREIGGNHRIRRRVVVLLVDTVQNTEESGVDHIDHILQAVGVLREVQLSGVVG